jgi:adenylate cyclase
MIETLRAKIQKIAWQWRGVLIAAPSVAIVVLGLRAVGILQSWELAALDQLFILRGNATPETRVVIVDITEEDLQRLQRWPLSDQQLLQILQNIQAQKPAVLGLDIYRDLPVEPGHAELVEFMQTTPNLLGIKKVAGDRVKAPPALPYPDQVGANDLINDPDGKVRRFFLSIPLTPSKIEPSANQIKALDGIGVKLALQYLGQQNIFPEVIDQTKQEYRLGNLHLRPFNKNDGAYTQVDDRGYQLILNYRGGKDSFPRITMSDVQANKIPPGFFTGKVVLLGASAVSLNDLYPTPFSSTLAGIPQRMSGVEIHAQITSQLIDGATGDRPVLHSWTEAQELLWIVSWSLVGGILTWSQRNTSAKLRNRPQQQGWRILLRNSSLVIATLSLGLFSYVCFQSALWIPLVPPLLALWGSSLSITAYIAKTAGDIRATFGRYLTDDVVATLLEDPDGIKLGGDRRLITILTSDLRGFTALAERLPPEEVVQVLNLYLGAMAEVITAYQGTIDEFMGDGILVLFGAPMQRADDPQRAVACAIAMQLAMEQVNAEMQKLGLSNLKMGIGINTGEVVVGNIGSTKRSKYGVVGSQVNLTYRIESYTTAGQILISEATYRAVPEVKVSSCQQVNPKGVKEPIHIYTVQGIGGKYNLTMADPLAEILYSLPEPIALSYSVLQDKDISTHTIPATLIRLGYGTAEIKSPATHPIFTNIKLNLYLHNSDLTQEDIYAKVLEQNLENNSFCVAFTALPPPMEVALNQLYKSCQSPAP